MAMSDELDELIGFLSSPSSSPQVGAPPSAYATRSDRSGNVLRDSQRVQVHLFSQQKDIDTKDRFFGFSLLSPHLWRRKKTNLTSEDDDIIYLSIYLFFFFGLFLVHGKECFLSFAEASSGVLQPFPIVCRNMEKCKTATFME
jgi:hypothetical protein